MLSWLHVLDKVAVIESEYLGSDVKCLDNTDDGTPERYVSSPPRQAMCCEAPIRAKGHL